jgi:hypothetical protein
LLTESDLEDQYIRVAGNIDDTEILRESELLLKERPELFSALEKAKADILAVVRDDEKFPALAALNRDPPAFATEPPPPVIVCEYVIWCEQHGYIDTVMPAELGAALEKHGKTDGEHNMRTEKRCNVLC